MEKETLQAKLPTRAKNNNSKITTKPGKIAIGNKLKTEEQKIAGLPVDISAKRFVERLKAQHSPDELKKIQRIPVK